MSKIIGIFNTEFVAKDGTEIRGKTLYLTDPIDPKRGQGEAADRCFLSEAKLAALGFTLAVGQHIDIYYNRYGKIASIALAEDAIID